MAAAGCVKVTTVPKSPCAVKVLGEVGQQPVVALCGGAHAAAELLRCVLDVAPVLAEVQYTARKLSLIHI
eukprot:11167368-Alexandrium_andersonii.AAC.1